jgi:hypothetical protein
MTNMRSLVVSLAASSVLFFPVNGAGQAEEASTIQKQIAEDVVRVNTDNDLMNQIEAARDLAELTRRIYPSHVTDAELTSIESLLDNPNDAVRGWVAGALGNLGPRAKSAVPKLLQLLHDVEEGCPMVRGLNSSGAIRLALERIGETPPPPPQCNNQK